MKWLILALFAGACCDPDDDIIKRPEKSYGIASEDDTGEEQDTDSDTSLDPYIIDCYGIAGFLEETCVGVYAVEVMELCNDTFPFEECHLKFEYGGYPCIIHPQERYEALKCLGYEP